MKNQLTHAAFGALVLKYSQQKESLQKRFENGLTIRAFAQEISQGAGAAKSILTAIGVKCGREVKKDGKAVSEIRIAKLEQQVQLIASQLGIKLPE